MALCKALRPSTASLVFFLDDLQWADSASLNLLRSLLESPLLEHIMIIASYRNNEVDKDHALTVRQTAAQLNTYLNCAHSSCHPHDPNRRR